MEGEAVIEAAVGEGNKVAHTLRRFLRIQLAIDQGAVVHRNGERRVLIELAKAGNQRGVIHGQRGVRIHLVQLVCTDIALDLRTRHGDEGIRLAVLGDAAQNVHGRARLHVGHSVAARHIQQLGIRIHGSIRHGGLDRLADVDVIELAQIANLHIGLIEHLVHILGIRVVLLIGQGFLRLGFLAGLEINLASLQILCIAQDEIAVIGGNHVGDVAHVFKRQRARDKFLAIELAALGHRIAAQHLLFGGTVLVVSLHGFLEVRAARNGRGDSLRLGIAAQFRDIRRFFRRGLGLRRFILGRLAIHLGDVDALHQAHAFRRIEDFVFVHIIVDERIQIGVVFLLRGDLLVKRGLHLILGHGDIRRRLFIQVVEHIVQLSRFHQAFFGIARLRQLILHGLRQLVAGIAGSGEIAFQIFAGVIQRGLHLRGQFGLLFLGQLIAVLGGIMADDGRAQLALHRLLRNGSLKFGVIFVHVVAILRVIRDILAEHVVKFILNFGLQHRHRAVVRGSQHSVVQCRHIRLFFNVLVRRFFGDDDRRSVLIALLGDRLFRRLGGGLFRRLGRRFLRRLGGGLFRRLGRRFLCLFGSGLFRRLGRRFLCRFGSGFFRRRFGHNRRGRRFRRFFLIAARAQGNQRDGQHQGQKTLLH